MPKVLYMYQLILKNFLAVSDTLDIFMKIDDFGGVIPAIEAGYFQSEIAQSASDYQKRIDTKSRIIVGVNEFINNNEDTNIPILEIRKEVYKEQVERLKELRLHRNNNLVSESLAAITDASSKEINLMPLIIEAGKSYATLGEIVDSMKVVFGEWEESAII